MSECKVVAVRERANCKTAILFVHGGGGDVRNTWGKFPQYLAEAPELEGWDIFSIGYESHLLRLSDYRHPSKLWVRQDPAVETLVGWLITEAHLPPLARYESIAIVSHSLGGVIAQRALLDSDELRSRVGHLFLFGVSSDGFRRFPLDTLMAQLRDIRPASSFITKLRDDWNRRFVAGNHTGFKYWAIAGTEDGFVKPYTSVEPFPIEVRRYVPGDHEEMVKPEAPDSASVRLVIEGITDNEHWNTPLNAAAIAVETREFERRIARLGASPERLDDRALVRLALAYDGLGQRDKAMEVLRIAEKRNETDAMGTLAGRYKRRWLALEEKEDADEALRLYQAAYRLSLDAEHWPQAYYHAINIAFMLLIYRQQREEACEMARCALRYCERSPIDVWRRATEGEARIHLQEADASLASYGAALSLAREAWQLESMYSQAIAVAGFLGMDDYIPPLTPLFQGWPRTL